MRQFRNFKKVCSSPAHKASRKVPVKKAEALLFKMTKNIVTHVCFYHNAKIMSPVIYKPQGRIADSVSYNHKRNQYKEKAHFSLRNDRVQDSAGRNRKTYIDYRN